MELRKQRFLWITGLFVSLLVLTSFTQSNLDVKSNEGLDSPPILSANHFDFVSEILDSKLDEYNSSGYFSQIYQPSLQATYYALFILDRIGRLSDINQSRILNYIMSCYNQSSSTFTDDYSQRYLDMNASKTYYPYSSLLEVNCYAILSLEILNSRYQIDEQKSIDFIWSCYQPITSGFIGQPYNAGLAEYFKISTDYLFGLSNVQLQNPVVITDAIEWHQNGMDFADAVHLAQSKESEAFVTFDKKFIKSALKTTTVPVREP